jgi:hypothetical protein
MNKFARLVVQEGLKSRRQKNNGEKEDLEKQIEEFENELEALK